MQGRLERLRKGDDASIENYSTEFDQSFEDYDHNIDFDGFMQNNANLLIDEDQYLTTLIDQAKDCIQTETDAKAEALLEKYIQLR